MPNAPRVAIIDLLLPSPWPLIPFGSPKPPVCTCAAGVDLISEGFSVVGTNAPTCTVGFGKATGTLGKAGSLACTSNLGGSTGGAGIWTTLEDLDTTNFPTAGGA